MNDGQRDKIGAPFAFARPFFNSFLPRFGLSVTKTITVAAAYNIQEIPFVPRAMHGKEVPLHLSNLKVELTVLLKADFKDFKSSYLLKPSLSCALTRALRPLPTTAAITQFRVQQLCVSRLQIPCSAVAQDGPGS